MGMYMRYFPLKIRIEKDEEGLRRMETPKDKDR
jgi:hypothetical protein